MIYILALDQGTTSSRSIVFDHSGSVVSTAQKELRQIFPKPGWIEHDPIEIWADQFQMACDALRSANLTAADISAIGITNQRETTIIWDRLTGQPIHQAIVWQDRRTAEYCDRIRGAHAETIRAKTGLRSTHISALARSLGFSTMCLVPDQRPRTASSPSVLWTHGSFGTLHPGSCI
jgi:glycerol kinase